MVEGEKIGIEEKHEVANGLGDTSSYPHSPY